MTTVARYRTPGIYYERVDTPPPIHGVRTDIAGFVGITERGPISEFAPRFQAVRVESVAQFRSLFGGLIPNGYLAYAVEGFFANGGRVCYVVRAADPDRVKRASVGLTDDQGGTALLLQASSPGAWANGLRATVARLGPDRFNLTLESPSGVRESFRNLSLTARPESADQRDVETVVNTAERSFLVAARVIPRADGGVSIPEERSWNLEGGTDGLASLSPDHLIEALQALEKVDEVAILAAPDLMSKPFQVPAPAPMEPHRCDVLDQPLVDGTRYVVQKDDALAALAELLCVTEDELRLANGLASGAVLTVGQVLRIPPPRPSPPEYPPAFTVTQVSQVQREMVAQCERQRDRFAILDIPHQERTVDAALAWREPFTTPFAALYYPWLRVPDPLRLGGSLWREAPPSGHVAGLYARSDLAIGVHKAPANEALVNVLDTAEPVDDVAHGDLNTGDVNVIRPYAGRGIRVFGARTTSENPWFRYVNARRLLSMIEEACEEQLQWTVFEPANHLLWLSIERALTGFLTALWQKGMLGGATPEEAFFVHCDQTTNPPGERELGRVITLVGLAIAAPMEFVIVRIGRTGSGVAVLEEIAP